MVDSYLTFLIDTFNEKHESMNFAFPSTCNTDRDAYDVLVQGRTTLRQLMQSQFDRILEDYLRRLEAQASKNMKDQNTLDMSIQLACNLHAHKLLLYQNYTKENFNENVCKSLIGSFIYLTTRHQWNSWRSSTLQFIIAEPAIYGILQRQRRKLIEWTKGCNQGVVDEIMQTALLMSHSITGSLKTDQAKKDNSNIWSRIKGEKSVGRWAVASYRTNEAKDKKVMPSHMILERTANKIIQCGEVEDNGRLGVEIDLQLGQMTLRSKYLTALPPSITACKDVVNSFGNVATIQSSLVEKAFHRELYRLVGLNHEIEYWLTPHYFYPPLPENVGRIYNPSYMAPSEKWISKVVNVHCVIYVYM